MHNLEPTMRTYYVKLLNGDSDVYNRFQKIEDIYITMYNRLLEYNWINYDKYINKNMIIDFELLRFNKLKERVLNSKIYKDNITIFPSSIIDYMIKKIIDNVDDYETQLFIVNNAVEYMEPPREPEPVYGHIDIPITDGYSYINNNYAVIFDNFILYEKDKNTNTVIKYINKSNVYLRKICNRWYLLIKHPIKVQPIKSMYKYDHLCINFYCYDNIHFYPKMLEILSEEKEINRYNFFNKILGNNWILAMYTVNSLNNKLRNFVKSAEEYRDVYIKIQNITHTFMKTRDEDIHNLAKYICSTTKNLRIETYPSYLQDVFIDVLTGYIREYSNKSCTIDFI